MNREYIQHSGKTVRRGRSLLVAGAVILAAAVSGCANEPPATLPASGVTSSNGGGMRTTGAIPDVGVSNGSATIGAMPANPRVPRY